MNQITGDRGLSRRRFLGSAAAIGAGAMVPGSVLTAAATARRFTLVYFTKFLAGLDPAEIATVIRKFGLAGLDLAVRPGHWVNPDNVAEALPKALAIWKEAGLDVALVSTETNLTSPSHPAAEAIYAACGARRVPNIKIGYWRAGGDRPYRTALDQARRDLEGFAALSRRHGVRTLLHTHAGSYLTCNATGLMLLAAAHEPALVGAYLDPAHLAVNGEPLDLALDIVGPHLAMVAAKNAAYIARPGPDGTTWRKEMCLLSEGLVDWRAALGLLERAGYRGVISLHGEYAGAEEREAILAKVATDAAYLLKLTS